MRKALLLAVGVLLFVGGVVGGVLSQRGNTPFENAPKGDDVSRKKTRPPTVAEETTALVGLWISSDEYSLIKFTEENGEVSAYLLNSEGSDYLYFELAEIDDKRVLVEYYDEDPELKNPLYEYQLQGDRLELKRLAHTKIQDSRKHSVRENLNGTWFRVRVNK